jgi:hypothetical protein
VASIGGCRWWLQLVGALVSAGGGFNWWVHWWVQVVASISSIGVDG